MRLRLSQLVCAAGLALAACVFTPLSAAQTPTVTVQGGQSCGSRGFVSGMTCYAATVINCPGDDNLQFVYGVENPTGTSGTIVMFSGGGGGVASDLATDPSEIAYYVSKGYQVVQIAWGPGTSGDGLDWEYTSANLSSGTNILTAACRPSTLLNWVRNGGPYASGLWTSGGMCAQGESAGSGAIAYALAWYSAGSYLDKVLLKSGPVFSDIEQGCEVPNNQYTTICSGSGQAGCVGWTPQDPPGYSLEFVGSHKSEVQLWTGNMSPSCANNSQQTNGSENTAWYNMSIVNFPATGQQPSFNYTNTAMSAWLCETVEPGVAPDNAAPQGQLFYQQFTSLSQAAFSLSVNAVTLCPSNEGVDNGIVASTGDYGYQDIETDMTDPVKGCKVRH